MKAITGIGIGVAIGGIMLGALMEGTNPIMLVNIPALLIIGGGTLGATMASTSFATFMSMPKLAITAAKGQDHDPSEAIHQMVELAEKARRNGLLALEEDVNKIDDAYTRKGLQLVVDGTDSDLVRSILESEIDGMAQRHHEGATPFKDASGFAPTIGVLGTVMGLVVVLGNLDEPAKLGPHIAGAFLATLYGVGSANLIFLPIANKLKAMSGEEANHRTMVLEAILSIQAGDNPRVLAEKLETFVPPAKRPSAAKADGKPVKAAAEPEPLREAA
jgi:chemotaxis protein MotA